MYKNYSSINSLNKRKIIDIVNSIYKKWTGKTKVVCHKNKVRVNRKSVTPYVLQETTIGKDKIPIKEYIIPLSTYNRSLAEQTARTTIPNRP